MKKNLRNTSGRFVLFGEAMGLILGTGQARLETAHSVTISIAGAESNSAIGLARLGQECRYHTVVGNDPYGERILRVLRSEGVNVDGVQIAEDTPTGLISRNCFSWREPDVFYHRHGSAFEKHCDEAAAALHPGAEDVFFTSGITLAIGERSRNATTDLLQRASKAGANVCLDVNFRRKMWSESDFRTCIVSLLPCIHTLFVGLEEGRILTKRRATAGIAKALLDHGVREVVIKDGACGASHHAANTAALRSAAFRLNHVVDCIGAGDAFNAGYLAGRALGQSRQDCLRMGNASGALVCLTPGDWESLPNRGQLEQFMSGNTSAVR